MESLAAYLLKSAIWISGFALVYLAFLRNERFFRLKRIYLLCGIIASFICPIITLHYNVVVAPPVEVTAGPWAITDQLIQAPAVENKTKPMDFTILLAAFYLAGILVIISKNIFSLYRIFHIIRKSKTKKLGKARLIRSSEYSSSFSFFSYVFINPSVDEGEMKEIMNHELVHVRQKHWLDLLLGELLRIFQWVNPFAWIYTGFIRLNHEYLADEAALQRTSDPAFYKAALLNQVLRAPVISLTNSFNYSITKTRFDMMKKIATSPYRKLKVLTVLPLFAVNFYSFATAEYHYADEKKTSEPLTIYKTSPLLANASLESGSVLTTGLRQQLLKGTVKDTEGKPLEGVFIRVTDRENSPSGTKTDRNGYFEINVISKDAAIEVFFPAYKTVRVKPDFNAPMNIKMEKDPDYKPSGPAAFFPGEKALVVLDGVVTDKTMSEVRNELGHNFGLSKMIQPKEAMEKYGEKAANGVMEVLTRKKAIEMGLNPPYPRLEPDDFPTFQGNKLASFNDWVADHVQYPADAKARDLEGWVFVNFKIMSDGSISDINPSGEGDKILQDEVIKVINSVGSFEPAKNVEAREPMTSTVSIRFKLPDQISRQAPFIVVQEMPMYPGGDKALLQFIKDNVNYPEELKAAKIGGRVIIRFAVNTEGDAEAVSVLKGVHPDLDREAIKVVKLLKGFKPGKQGGIPVPVWYMVPVTFGDVQSNAAPTGSPFSGSSSVEILKFIAENTKYPFDARKNSNQGKIYVRVKMQKGGIVRESKAVRAKEGINVPIIPEIVIVGYKSEKASDPNELRAKDSNPSVSDDKGMELLEKESERVANLLGNLNIPEWKDKDMEFALSFNYILK